MWLDDIKLLPKYKKTGVPRGPKPTITGPRELAMAELYKEGKTLRQLGAIYGITGERVRQIMVKLGVPSTSGGAAVRLNTGRENKLKQKDARSIKKYGIASSQMDTYRKSGMVVAYRYQKRNANNRSIPWELSFAQWIQIWEESGKISQRGRGSEGYCMCRNDDEGPYSIGNVFIQSGNGNGKDAIKNKGGHKAKYTGVWCLYPGSKKPWIAKFGRVSLGYFATEEEGFKARENYIATIPPKIIKETKGTRKSASGVNGVYKSKNGWVAHPYFNGKQKYIGYYKTIDLAKKAIAKYLNEQKETV